LTSKKLLKKENLLKTKKNIHNDEKLNQLSDMKNNVPKLDENDNNDLDKPLSDKEISKIIEDIDNNHKNENNNDTKPLIEVRDHEVRDDESIGSHVSTQSRLKGIETKERVKLLLMRSMSSDKLKLRKNDMDE